MPDRIEVIRVDERTGFRDRFSRPRGEVSRDHRVVQGESGAVGNEDATAAFGGGVVRHGAVGQFNTGAFIVDRQPAALFRSVVRENAVADGGVTADHYATARSTGDVTHECAVTYGQRRNRLKIRNRIRARRIEDAAPVNVNARRCVGKDRAEASVPGEPVADDHDDVLSPDATAAAIE